MPNVFLTDEEACNIIEFFDNSCPSVEYEKAMLGVNKISESLGGGALFKKCSECDEYFNVNDDDGYCPDCGAPPPSIGNMVKIPCPEASDEWEFASTGTITGIEIVDGVEFAIVQCTNGKTWFIKLSRLEQK